MKLRSKEFLWDFADLLEKVNMSVVDSSVTHGVLSTLKPGRKERGRGTERGREALLFCYLERSPFGHCAWVSRGERAETGTPSARLPGVLLLCCEVKCRTPGTYLR
jgi:hypothetical protein